jgi:hypothetical protein
MVKRYKSYLHGGQRAVGSMDDAFFIAEDWFKKGGEAVGTGILGMTKKQADRHNKLLKTVKELESKTHFTHSPLQRDIKTLGKFHNGMLDAPTQKLKKRLDPYKYYK